MDEYQIHYKMNGEWHFLESHVCVIDANNALLQLRKYTSEEYKLVRYKNGKMVKAIA